MKARQGLTALTPDIQLAGRPIPRVAPPFFWQQRLARSCRPVCPEVQ